MSIRREKGKNRRGRNPSLEPGRKTRSANQRPRLGPSARPKGSRGGSPRGRAGLRATKESQGAPESQEARRESLGSLKSPRSSLRGRRKRTETPWRSKRLRNPKKKGNARRTTMLPNVTTASREGSATADTEPRNLESPPELGASPDERVSLGQRREDAGRVQTRPSRSRSEVVLALGQAMSNQWLCMPTPSAPLQLACMSSTKRHSAGETPTALAQAR